MRAHVTPAWSGPRPCVASLAPPQRARASPCAVMCGLHAEEEAETGAWGHLASRAGAGAPGGRGRDLGTRGPRGQSVHAGGGAGVWLPTRHEKRGPPWPPRNASGDACGAGAPSYAHCDLCHRADGRHARAATPTVSEHCGRRKRTGGVFLQVRGNRRRRRKKSGALAVREPVPRPCVTPASANVPSSSSTESSGCKRKTE